MRTPLFLLGALGTLSAATPGLAAEVDTSNWKCESCPFEKGAKGSVEVGLRNVSDDSAKFGDYTGLNEKGVGVDATGSVRYRGADGGYGRLDVVSLVPDAVSLSAEGGFEGGVSFRLGYEEIPRFFTDTALSPFIGNGGGMLTLPAGFPAPSTSAMPLATTLQPVELAYKRSRLDGGINWIAGENWVTSLTVRHDVRDGTKRSAGSFYSTSSQLAAPVDQVTDQLEIATSYATRRLQAKLAYQLSRFSNNQTSLTWSNPFTPVVAGADRGQLALAPDNQFHQIVASAAYEFDPMIRGSADLAWGRMTQDAAYLAPTLNTALAATVPALPAQSLHGKAETFNASVRVTATPNDSTRVNAVYSRDVRDNQTPIESYPAISTDMFLGTEPRSNLPYSLTQDRFKINAELRGADGLKGSIGFDFDARERSYQEVVTTRESTVWGRMAGQPFSNTSASVKLLFSERSNSTYGIAQWVDPPQNPLMRKYYLADRQRSGAELRADVTIAENVTLGLNADFANDNYNQSQMGLTEGRDTNLGADMAVALSEKTQMHLFLQSERIRSQQAGSQTTWSASNDDRIDSLGIGVRHAAIPDKLDIGADLAYSRSRSDVAVEAGIGAPPFPTAETRLDIVKLYATYKVQDNIWVTGSFWYQSYDSRDWRLDGVAPNTVSNLLAFGEQSPHYHVNVLRIGLRYKF